MKRKRSEKSPDSQAGFPQHLSLIHDSLQQVESQVINQASFLPTDSQQLINRLGRIRGLIIARTQNATQSSMGSVPASSSSSSSAGSSHSSSPLRKELIAEITLADTKGKKDRFRKAEQLMDIMNRGLAELQHKPDELINFLCSQSTISPYTPLIIVLVKYVSTFPMADRIVNIMKAEKDRKPIVQKHLKDALYFLCRFKKQFIPSSFWDRLTDWSYENPKIGVTGYTTKKPKRISQVDFTKDLLKYFLETVDSKDPFFNAVRNRVLAKATFEEKFEYAREFFIFSPPRYCTLNYKTTIFNSNQDGITRKAILNGDGRFDFLNKMQDSHLDLLGELLDAPVDPRSFLSSCSNSQIKDDATNLFIILITFTNKDYYVKIRSLLKSLILYVDFNQPQGAGYLPILYYLKNNPLGLALFLQVMIDLRGNWIQLGCLLGRQKYENQSLLESINQSHQHLSERLAKRIDPAYSQMFHEDVAIECQAGCELFVGFYKTILNNIMKSVLSFILPEVLINLVSDYYCTDIHDSEESMRKAKGQGSVLLTPAAFFSAQNSQVSAAGVMNATLKP